MTGNTFGKLLKITTWGESHGPAIGVVIDGCPPNLDLSTSDIQIELDKRKPGQSKIFSARKEDNAVEILSGVFEGKTTGCPISLLIRNMDKNSYSYDSFKHLFRPGHADYTYHRKYGVRDYRGGGRSSGRETAARVAAGAIAKKIILSHGIKIIAYTKQIRNIITNSIDLSEVEKNNIRCPDKEAAILMEKEILDAKSKGDSVGGIVEIIVEGCPAGLGDPVFDKLSADLGKALLSIGAIKGIEFGRGFDVANLLGSENNDSLSKSGFNSNNSGGILGGISNGDRIIIRLAIKPTPSISVEQNTINLEGNEEKIKVVGRHDSCIVPRICVVAESMVALVLADKLLISKAYK